MGFIIYGLSTCCFGVLRANLSRYVFAKIVMAMKLLLLAYGFNCGIRKIIKESGKI
jgi:uncharacterized membrane protein